MPGYYLTAALIIAGLYAIRLANLPPNERSSKKFAFDRIIVANLVVFSLLMIVCSGITGDMTGKYLAKYEPAKLAP